MADDSAFATSTSVLVRCRKGMEALCEYVRLHPAKPITPPLLGRIFKIEPRHQRDFHDLAVAALWKALCTNGDLASAFARVFQQRWSGSPNLERQEAPVFLQWIKDLLAARFTTGASLVLVLPTVDRMSEEDAERETALAEAEALAAGKPLPLPVAAAPAPMRDDTDSMPDYDRIYDRVSDDDEKSASSPAPRVLSPEEEEAQARFDDHNGLVPNLQLGIRMDDESQSQPAEVKIQEFKQQVLRDSPMLHLAAQEAQEEEQRMASPPPPPARGGGKYRPALEEPVAQSARRKKQKTAATTTPLNRVSLRSHMRNRPMLPPVGLT